MTKSLMLLICCIAVVSCSTKEWKPSSSILLGEITPIGFDIENDQIWISDGDHNQVVITNLDGVVKDQIEIQRPMHLEVLDGVGHIPSYGSDQVFLVKNDLLDSLDLDLELEAPAAVSVSDEIIAIADFYNHRIVLKKDGQWISFGKNGKGPGEFNYPTDVQIFNKKIYVADAYNNRLQVFDEDGQHLMTIGEDQKINAATGIFVNDIYIMTTDFENDRVLIFNHDGKTVDIIDKGLNKPTDLLMNEETLLVCNYKGKYISIFEKS